MRIGMSDANGATPDTNSGGGRPGGGASTADNDAAGSGAVPGIVQEPVVEIVNRVRIVVVEVEAIADEQSGRVGKLRMRREAGVGMPHDDARPGLSCAKERPGVDDVGLAKAPFEVTGGAGMIATRRGRADRGPRVHVCDVVFEEGLGVNDLGLLSKAIHRVPCRSWCQSAARLRRHELELASFGRHRLDAANLRAAAVWPRVRRHEPAIPGARRRPSAQSPRTSDCDSAGGGPSSARAGSAPCFPGSIRGFGLRHTILLAQGRSDAFNSDMQIEES